MAFERFKALPRWAKLLIFLALAAIIIALLLLIWLRSRPAPTPAAQQPVTTVPQQPAGALPSVPVVRNAGILADIEETAPTTAPAETTDQTLLLLAQSFVERFGSYSNQGRFQNLDDLKIFMTPSMQTWVDGYKADLEKEHGDFNTYYGIDTFVISKTVDSLDEATGKATITLKTQRQEFTTATGAPRVFYQDMRLELLKITNEWKVNGAYWL